MAPGSGHLFGHAARAFDNGVKVIPSYLLESQPVDKTNWEEILIGSGYYTADQLQ